MPTNFNPWDGNQTQPSKVSNSDAKSRRIDYAADGVDNHHPRGTKHQEAHHANPRT